MAVIKLSRLGGIAPSVLPRALPDDGAQTAHNLLARTTEFRPLLNNIVAASSAVSNPSTIYRFARTPSGQPNSDMSQGWRTAAAVVSVVRGSVNEDELDRSYVTIDNGTGDPAVIDAAGGTRPLGVPPPGAKPTTTVNDIYVFTKETKQIELNAALQQAIKGAIAAAELKYVGLGNDTPIPGWVNREMYDPDPLMRDQVVRIFAVDPATKRITNTYSAMSPQDATWVLDPALGGAYSGLAPGLAAPSWAAGATMWWCIPMFGYAQVRQVNQTALTAALAAIPMPGKQDDTKLLKPSDIAEIVSRMVAIADPAGANIGNRIAALKAKQRDVNTLFSNGGEASLAAATTAFYGTAAVTNEIEAAKTVFCEAIWGFAERLAKAVAKPPEQIDNDGPRN